MECRPGKQNVVADALSRRDEEQLAVHALSVPQFAIFDGLRTELASNAQARELLSQLEAGTAQAGWSVVDGLLLFQGKVFLPDDSEFGSNYFRLLMNGVMKVLRRCCITSGHPFTTPI